MNLKVSICVLVSQIKCWHILLWHSYMHGDVCTTHLLCHWSRSSDAPESIMLLYFINVMNLRPIEPVLHFPPMSVVNNAKYLTVGNHSRVKLMKPDVSQTWTRPRTCWKSNMSAAAVSQGSVVACLRCGGKYNKSLTSNLLQNATVRILKIGQHLPKLCLNIYKN